MLKTTFTLSCIRDNEMIKPLINALEGREFDDLITLFDAISDLGFTPYDITSIEEDVNLCICITYIDTTNNNRVGNAPNYYISVTRPKGAN